MTARVNLAASIGALAPRMALARADSLGIH
jgi:hypothetical protein